MSDKTILLLGGAGLVGVQVARQIARDIRPEKIILATLYQREIREVMPPLEKEFPQVQFIGLWGDVFVRADFTEEKRMALLQSADRRQDLFEDMMGDTDATYARSQLVKVILEHKPDVIVDSINTATAISYQDAYTASILAKQKVDALFARLENLGRAVRQPDVSESELNEAMLQGIIELDKMRKEAKRAFDVLILSQAVPQLVRHSVLILRAMEEVKTRLYLKIGTTGTGGMGLNIPYTHGEDKPSAKLMAKTAVGFAHTGLMFLMARTPGAPIVKEIKPAAMIGYSDIALRSITERGEQVHLYKSRKEKVGDQLTLRENVSTYENLGKLQMVVVDTGENGMFTKGEFAAITAVQQMEFITPEEIASKVVLEIKGQNTGGDVIAAVDGAVLDPTYRAGVLRRSALEEISRLEDELDIPSIALGQLGPPELSKLLYEAYLLKARYGTLSRVLRQRPKRIADALYHYVLRNTSLRNTIASVGLPILSPDSKNLLRGPMIRIPERADVNTVLLTPESIDQYARKGWVDLRPENFVCWKERIEKMRHAKRQLPHRGSAAITMEAYLDEEIHIGDVVAWVFNNEEIGYRIK
jgi:hypothetical protein